MTEPTVQTAPIFTDDEKYMIERMEYTQRLWQRRLDEAKQRVADNASSDWSLLTDLAAAYGRQEEMRRLNNYLLAIKDGRLVLQDALINWLDSIMSDLLMARVNNSSSSAANLVAENKLAALQDSHGLVTGWLAWLADADGSN